MILLFQKLFHLIPLSVRLNVTDHHFSNAFYNHHPCHVVIYTGATSSAISRSFLKAAGITPRSVLHSAQSADKSQLDVKDEVHITLNFAGMDLPITALVLDKLDCVILSGISFCKINYIN